MNSDFKKIKLDMLAKYQISPVDIYLNIGSKFVKIISKETSIIMADLKHYIAKDIEFVYVSDENYKSVLNEISLKMQNAKQSIQAQKIEMTAFTFQYVKGKLQNLNVHESDIAMIYESTQSFIAELNHGPGQLPKPMKDRLAIFFAREDYLVNHALMTLFLTTLLTQKLAWNSEQTYLKINYAAIFSDIMLDSPYLAKIRRHSDPEYLKLNQEQKDLVDNHQAKAIEMLQSAGILMSDIESLILNHHELPDGSGFNRGLFADKISPLSCAFNIVYYFCQEYLNKDVNQIELPQIIANMEELFNRGNYKQPYKAFVQLIA